VSLTFGQRRDRRGLGAALARPRMRTGLDPCRRPTADGPDLTIDASASSANSALKKDTIQLDSEPTGM